MLLITKPFGFSSRSSALLHSFTKFVNAMKMFGIPDNRRKDFYCKSLNSVQYSEKYANGLVINDSR